MPRLVEPRLLALLRLLIWQSAVLLVAIALPAFQAFAQATGGADDSTAVVSVRVQGDSMRGAIPIESAIVRSGTVGARTETNGLATLRLRAGSHVLIASKLGFRPDTIPLVVTARRDTIVVATLIAQAVETEAIIVTSTRGGRRIEDTPIRVEVIDDEEIAEKVAMSPGDIAMMLNETSGLRVQAINPSLGGANVRIQGLRGRYTLMLADGLPLYGAQTGGLGLLQIPPVDLGRVEIIKGSASALYGSSALGGVIDLVSRRPGDERERTLLVNQTSRGGTDGVFFGSGTLAEGVGATLLAGAHTQQQNDLDSDGWTDMPGYTRFVVRPRLFLDNGTGRSAFITGGYTGETRRGGTLDGRLAPDGDAFRESLRTDRSDVGALLRWVAPDTGSLFGIRALRSSILTLRASGVEQRHAHRFGVVGEDDRHRTWFGEAALAVPRGAATYIIGAAFQSEQYRARDVPGFDYNFSIPAAFAQIDVDARRWLSISTSARLDAHSEYGTFLNPRMSVLFRSVSEGMLEGWSTRLSGGTGAFAPTPFVEEAEVAGLTFVLPLRGLIAERATSASLDVGGPIASSFGEVEVNATAFTSTVRDPVQAITHEPRLPSSPAAQLGLRLVNGPGETHTWGTELLARVTRELGEGEEAPALRITGSYTYLRSTECTSIVVVESDAPELLCSRGDVALTPRHSAGVVTTIEQEGRSRIGLELYYTGRQRLDANPFRNESRPYLIVGVMADRAFQTRAGVARVFVNFENITNVRQTRLDSLVLPERGAGGRWTTDAWTDLSGFTVNGGVRWAF